MSTFIKIMTSYASPVFLGLFVLACGWAKLLSRHILAPVMDEAFHIRQVQRYCRGDYGWDPMITTPPGLYGYSMFLLKFLRLDTRCSILSLRYTSSIALLLLALIVCMCRVVTATKHGRRADLVSAETVHTTVNICLFPPLFFFSGLYYTDIVSTAVVMLSYWMLLSKRGPVAKILCGIVALFMRQTNVFWVAVFPALCEWISNTNTLDYHPFSRTDAEGVSSMSRLPSWISTSLRFFARGNIHDPQLHTSTVMDLLVCGVSIVVSALAHLPKLLLKTYSSIIIVITFIAFVIWNGGVVLGDKTAHVAQLHLPQMLYIWPFMVVLSFPLLAPYAINMLLETLSFLNTALKSPKSVFTRDNLVYIGWLSVTEAALLVIVHFNTIIHKYTLADNRHYVYYAFKYTVRRPGMKYLMTPGYIACALLCIQCLASSPVPAWDSLMKKFKAKIYGISTSSTASVNKVVVLQEPDHYTSASFFLIWLLTTTLSLITAPLVEPRYYLIPWVFWRLHVSNLSVSSARNSKQSYTPSLTRDSSYDHRLWFETIWYLCINAWTMYMLLYKPFMWPGHEEDLMRFMW